MINVYLDEAFKSMRSLNEDSFSVSDAGKLDKLISFVDDDVPVETEVIYDMDAKDVDELKDSYVGDGVLVCYACGAKFDKDKDSIVIDEESGLANVGDVCPLCGSEQGYTIEGVIRPFDKDTDFKPEEKEGDTNVDPDDISDVDEPRKDVDDDDFLLDGEEKANPDVDDDDIPVEDDDDIDFDDEEDNKKDESLKESAADNNLYYATDAANVESILDDGLNGAYFATTPEKAREEAEKAGHDAANLKVLKVNRDSIDDTLLHSCNVDEAADDEGLGSTTFKYDEVIEPEHIEVVEGCCSEDGENLDVNPDDKKVIKEEPLDEGSMNPYVRKIRSLKMESTDDSTDGEPVVEGDTIKEEDGELTWDEVFGSSADESLDEEKCPVCGDEIKSKDDMCAACKDKAAEKEDESLKNVKAASEDSKKLDEAVEPADLPTEVVVNKDDVGAAESDDEVDQILTDYLSDTYGWLVETYGWTDEGDSYKITDIVWDTTSEDDGDSEYIDDQGHDTRTGEDKDANYDAIGLGDDDDIDFDGDESLKNVKAASEDSKKLDEDVNLEANGENNVKVNKRDDGSISIEIGQNGEAPVDANIAAENVTTAPAEGEMIAPMDDATKADIENNVAPGEEGEPTPEDIPLETNEPVGEEPVGEPTPEEDMGVDEVQEESFNNMASDYMKRVYENVDNFKATDIKIIDNKQLVVEGIIKFNSGKERKTTFMFENAKENKKGQIVMEGKNETFTKANKPFTLRAEINESVLTPVSLSYNYNTKTLNESNEEETVRVYGRILAK